MSAQPTAHCPRCGQPSLLDNPSFPFCSKRCRLIDLGKWFNEEYRIEKEEQQWEGGESRAKPQSSQS